MNGEYIKERLRKDGVNLSELAKTLGYSNDQRWHSALKSDNIKSGLIEDIAKATNKSVCYYYEDSVYTANNGVAIKGDGNSVTSLSEKFVSLLEKKDEQLDRLITLLEKR